VNQLNNFVSFKVSALMGAVALSTSFAAQAQAWPSKQITFVVPFTAGSATDIMARVIGEKLGPRLGQTVLVENRVGAGGTIGTSAVAKSTPDGYTFVVVSTGHVVNPALYPKLSYDTLKDFDGITPLASLPNVIVVSPSKGYKDVDGQ